MTNIKILTLYSFCFNVKYFMLGDIFSNFFFKMIYWKTFYDVWCLRKIILYILNFKLQIFFRLGLGGILTESHRDLIET
jgi:hypothetical protein